MCTSPALAACQRYRWTLVALVWRGAASQSSSASAFCALTEAATLRPPRRGMHPVGASRRRIPSAHPVGASRRVKRCKGARHRCAWPRTGRKRVAHRRRGGWRAPMQTCAESERRAPVLPMSAGRRTRAAKRNRRRHIIYGRSRYYGATVYTYTFRFPCTSAKPQAPHGAWHTHLPRAKSVR
jgi:hypothetical protein